MSTELQNNLDAIKLDKETNLLPENLKAGITCLGVTGTNRNNIKLFSTVAAMNTDTDKQDGDMAVVYRTEWLGVNADSEFISVTFPETVTLDSEITSFIDSSFEDATTSDIQSGAQMAVYSEGANFEAYSSDQTYDQPHVEYSSSDGIHYTRTTFETNSGVSLTNPVQMRNVLKFEDMRGEGLSSVIGNFMLVESSSFDGIYECNGSSYSLAKNQFNLNNANQLLPSIRAYGKNGVVTGTSAVYNNLDPVNMLTSNNKNGFGYIGVGKTNIGKNIRHITTENAQSITNFVYDTTFRATDENFGNPYLNSGVSPTVSQNYMMFYSSNTNKITLTNLNGDILYETGVITATNVGNIQLCENPSNSNIVYYTYNVYVSGSGQTGYIRKLTLGNETTDEVITTDSSGFHGGYSNLLVINNSVYYTCDYITTSYNRMEALYKDGVKIGDVGETVYSWSHIASVKLVYDGTYIYGLPSTYESTKKQIYMVFDLSGNLIYKDMDICNTYSRGRFNLVQNIDTRDIYVVGMTGSSLFTVYKCTTNGLTLYKEVNPSIYPSSTYYTPITAYYFMRTVDGVDYLIGDKVYDITNEVRYDGDWFYPRGWNGVCVDPNTPICFCTNGLLYIGKRNFKCIFETNNNGFTLNSTLIDNNNAHFNQHIYFPIGNVI